MNVDTLKMLGFKIPAGTAEIRDAVHVAIITTGVNVRCFPGQHVGVTAGLADPDASVKVGIIDPFLKDSVFPGEVCFLWLYPGTITSLTHHWSHPSFPAGPISTNVEKFSNQMWREENGKLKELVEDYQRRIGELQDEKEKLITSVSMSRHEAEKYLRTIAEDNYVDYNEMLDELTSRGCYTQGGSTSLQELNHGPEEEKIWAAVFALTGVRHTGGPFSCSC
jgi:N-acyl-D-aspartate/D-glutamate deacylase